MKSHTQQSQLRREKTKFLAKKITCTDNWGGLDPLGPPGYATAYGLAGCFRKIRRLPQSGPLLISHHGTKLWPKNEIQNGGRSHLEFNSGGYF